MAITYFRQAKVSQGNRVLAGSRRSAASSSAIVTDDLCQQVTAMSPPGRWSAGSLAELTRRETRQYASLHQCNTRFILNPSRHLRHRVV